MNKVRKSVLGTVLAGAAVLGMASPAMAVTSPGGITDSRLCGGSNFSVVSGVVLHEFTNEGNYYVNGGIQRYWNEQEFFLGIFYSGRRFVVTC